MFGGASRFSHQANVVLQRRSVIADTGARTLIEIRDVAVMLVSIRIGEAVNGKRRRTAIRVMHDDDILNAEKMLCHRDRAERIDGSAACHDNLEKRSGRGNLSTLRVGDDFARVDLAEPPRDGRWNTYGAWVIAVD